MRWPFHIIVTVAAGACRSRSGRGAKPLDSIFEFDREYDLGNFIWHRRRAERDRSTTKTPRQFRTPRLRHRSGAVKATSACGITAA